MIRISFNTFNIRLSKTSTDLFALKNHITIKQIFADNKLTLPQPVVIIADPFLFTHDNTLYLFYEEQISTNNGIIKMTKTTDLKIWSPSIIVLRESFHLSYPFVFNESGDIYMIPESSQANSIRLYKSSTSDLKSWHYEHTLLEGHPFVDSCILHHDRIYYLFTSIDKEDKLRIYFSESLTGKFEEHPESPFITKNNLARNAGSIIRYNDQLFRPAQGQSKYYGESLAIFKITTLSPTNYKEELLNSNILPSADPIYQYGGHHINYVKFHNNNIVSTDFIQPIYNLPFLFARIVQKIRSLFS